MQERESLKDLPGVTVVVERFRSHAEDAGFDKQTLQTDVELKLRMAGIKVTEADHGPWLYVNVNALHRERNKANVYGISLELNQRVLLASQVRSDPGKSSKEALALSKMFGITWTSGSVGVGKFDDVRTAVKNLIDKFINDWLAVNPLRVAPVNPDGT